MERTPRQCPKCAGRMEQGFVLDSDYGSRHVGQWVAGAPRKSFWRGTKFPEGTQIPVGTFRCSGCGFLESYARTEFAAR